MARSIRQYKPIDLNKINAISITNRAHKVKADLLAELPGPDSTVGNWLDGLPEVLAVKSLRSVVAAVAKAYQADKPVVAAMGAHVIKVGCSPIIIDLMQRGIITGIVLHGAGAIHDWELASWGRTSEDVAANLSDGRFGMVSETADAMSQAAAAGSEADLGLGAAVGQLILNAKEAHAGHSMLAAARQLNLPACVHVALGTDTVHMHGQLDAAALARASMVDFRRLCSIVCEMDGGVWLNIGSAVLLPEVFLKAVAVAYNQGAKLDDMVAANFDMISHYRPTLNVISRPVKPGNGFNIIGHHEIMLPLLRMAILNKVKESSR